MNMNHNILAILYKISIKYQRVKIYSWTFLTDISIISWCAFMPREFTRKLFRRDEKQMVFSVSVSSALIVAGYYLINS